MSSFWIYSYDFLFQHSHKYAFTMHDSIYLALSHPLPSASWFIFQLGSKQCPWKKAVLFCIFRCQKVGTNDTDKESTEKLA